MRTLFIGARMKSINCWLVIYPGGARGDFVAGWMGTLDTFIDSAWHIDVRTGKSTLDIDWFKVLTQNPRLHADDILAQYGLRADPRAQYSIAGGFHADPRGNTAAQINANYNVVAIDPATVDFELADREYALKTNTTIDRSLDSYMQGTAFVTRTDAHVPITPVQRFKEIYAQLDTAVQLNYNKLFVPGGSKYLCAQTGLQASKQHHSLWDTNLARITQ